MSTPEIFYREIIDLNRYSVAVSEKYVVTYNEIILNAAKQLRSIDQRQVAEIAKGGTRIIAPVTRKRLRAIIKQSSDSLNTWWARSALDMKDELQGVAELQRDFVVNELKNITASGDVPINSVAISKDYADSVIMTDPSKVNIFTSQKFTEDDFVKFGSGKFSLTSLQGATIKLPNGQTVQKAFRGIAESSAERLDLAVRSGVFAGESLQQISRRLVGRLDFDDLQKASVRQMAQAGGELTKLANNQIQTIVRTSVNQVTNQASQAVYAANKKVAPKYEYVATLDSRTSAICQRLDGQKFDYNNGPTPPQHFNCRSTTVPVVDFDGLQKKYPNLEKPPNVVGRFRPSSTGQVPQGTAYGDWLLKQDKELQIKTLGDSAKVNYFKRLAGKEGSGQKALRKMIRNDGTKRSLKDLQRLYGKVSTLKPKAKAVAETVTAVKSMANTKVVEGSWGVTTDYKEAIRRGESMTKGRFEKANQLSKQYKKAFAEYETASENYFTYSWQKNYGTPTRLRKAGLTRSEAIDIYYKERAARRTKWLETRQAFRKIEVEGSKEMAILRKELLETNVTNAEIKETLDKLPFKNKTKALQAKVREQVEEFTKMFNGGGVTVNPNYSVRDGKISKVKLGTSRANNDALGEILVPFEDPELGYMSLSSKQTVFHEIGHSLEKVRKENLDMAVNFRASKITSNIPTKSAREVKKAWTLSESVLPDEFISPYAGRPYQKYDRILNKTVDTATEIVSMGVEHFADPELMFRLYTIDPDHFHMILSMTRNTY